MGTYAVRPSAEVATSCPCMVGVLSAMTATCFADAGSTMLRLVSPWFTTRSDCPLAAVATQRADTRRHTPSGFRMGSTIADSALELIQSWRFQPLTEMPEKDIRVVPRTGWS